MKKLLEWKPVRFGLEVGELYFSKRVSRSAAELAYFLILTFFPVLICINAFIGLLHLGGPRRGYGRGWKHWPQGSFPAPPACSWTRYHNRPDTCPGPR